MAAVAPSSPSDATQQSCIPTPGAVCQSKKAKDMGKEESEEMGERRMGSSRRTVAV